MQKYRQDKENQLFYFLEEENWDHSFDLHKLENYLDSKKFKIIMGYLAGQEKIGCGFNIWLPYTAELIKVKYVKKGEWSW